MVHTLTKRWIYWCCWGLAIAASCWLISRFVFGDKIPYRPDPATVRRAQIAENSLGASELHAIEIRWDDAFKLVSSSPRIAMAPQVAQLQTIRRDLRTVRTSACLRTAVESLDTYMGKVIDGFLEFMSQNEPMATSNFEEAVPSLHSYKATRDSCLT